MQPTRRCCLVSALAPGIPPNALRGLLEEGSNCVIYAQDPLAARAALRARRGPYQRVVLAVHFRISQADEWADKEQSRVTEEYSGRSGGLSEM